MSAFETIRVETDERGIARLTLNRPEKHNALDARMIVELTVAARDLGDDSGIRAVVLAAEGPSFCAGGDLGWMKDQAARDRAGKMEGARALADMLVTLNSLPKPLIGRVQGQAYGGGIGMMAVCDIVVAVKTARFALTETRLGLIPATIGPFVLRRIGENHARQIFFTGKGFDPTFALRAGLVSRVCHADELDEAIEAEITPILKTMPGAVAAAKAFCLALGGADPSALTELTAAALADRWETQEAMDGIGAFLAKS